MPPDTYVCPGCDREVTVGSRGCPHCDPLRKKRKPAKSAAGKAKPGWHQESTAEGLDLPDQDFDYDDFVAREFGGKPHRQIGIKWYWWLTALVLVVLMILAGGELWG